MNTSAWIDYMREEENEPTGRSTEIASRGHPFGIVGVIYQEVLQGAASQAKFYYLAEYLGSQRFYYPEDPAVSYREAALLYSRCRRAGVAVRSSSDCFIARVAIEHDLILLHNDSDFENMARVIPELTLA
ncbi:MAG: PIN domain-containing protein [Actinomycetota bacterium]|nr:PIN domain-containing protein [Actinomycetota bacterium]